MLIRVFIILLSWGFLQSPLLFARKTVNEADKLQASKLYDEGVKLTKDSDPEALWKAKEAFTTAIQLNPYYTEAFAELALLYLELNDSLSSSMKNLKKSIELARHVIELAPEQSIGYRVMADIMQEVGQYEEAETFIKRALYYNKNDADSLFVYGKVLLLQNPAKSAGFLRKAIKIKIAAGQQPMQYVHFYILALDHVPPKERVEQLEEISKEVKNEELLSALGEAYSRIGEFEKALKAYQMTLEIAPDNLRIIISGAIIKYLRLKKYDSAISDLKAALEKEGLTDDPMHAAIINGHLGIIHVIRRDLKEAIKYFRTAITYAPESVELANAISFAYQDNKLFEESLSFYTIAIELSPGISQYYALMASTLSQHLKKYREAISWIDKALAIDPDIAQYYSEKAFAFYYLQEYEKALSSFDNAIKLNPNDGINYYNKSCVLSLMGDNETSYDTLKKALDLSPELLDHAQDDPDLENLRKSKFWKTN